MMLKLIVFSFAAILLVKWTVAVKDPFLSKIKMKYASDCCGSHGVPGVPGVPGNTGKVGLHGAKGDLGHAGPYGQNGKPGAPGLPGVGGMRGFTGENGNPGPNGLKGEPGDYGLSGETGHIGETGDPGRPGEFGVKGERGFDGRPGEEGIIGVAGLPGLDGIDGLPGVKGEIGLAGLVGPKGEAGDNGSDGLDLRARSNWKQCAWKRDDDKDNGLIQSCVFNKKHDNTSLRVFYGGTLRIQDCNGCCKRWFFTFNEAECSKPMAIDGVVYMWKGKGTHSPHPHRHIEGYCNQVSKGQVRVGFWVGNCANHGDADVHSGSKTAVSRIVIEEVPPPQA